VALDKKGGEEGGELHPFMTFDLQREVLKQRRRSLAGNKSLEVGKKKNKERGKGEQSVPLCKTVSKGGEKGKVQPMAPIQKKREGEESEGLFKMTSVRGKGPP